jgi:iron complex outermembrane recepter protein
MRKQVLLVFMVLLATMVKAQNISGTVIDKSGQPVPFVTVKVANTELVTQTNEQGIFNFPKVAPGKYELQVSGVGFASVKHALDLGNTESDIRIVISKSTKELNEVQISGQKRRTSTATKTDIQLLDLPMSIQVVGQELIQQQQIIDIKDVVKNVSGVNQTGSYNGGYQYFNSRGFNMNNWTNFRRNGTLLWNMGNHYADFYESVEFLKGPTAILYGDVAPGGIINFVTKKPLNYTYGKFDMKAGEYGLLRPSIDVSGPLNSSKTLLYRFNGTYEYSESFRDVVNNKTVMLAPSLTWKVDPSTSWNVEAAYKNDDRVGDPGLVSPDGSFEGLKRLPVSTFLGERNGTYTYTNGSVFSTFKHYLNKNWNVQNILSYTHTTRRPLNIYTNNDADAQGNITRSQYFFKQRFDTYTASLDLVGEVYTGKFKHKILIGGDLVDDVILMQGFNEQDIPGTVNLYNPQLGSPLQALQEEDETSRGFYNRLGLYIQDQVSFLNDKVQVLVGLRYNNYENGTRYDNPEDKPDDYKSVKDNPLVPRLGLVIKPQEWLSLYGSFSRSYEINGFDWIDVNRLLDPTFGEQLEFGFKSNLLQQKLGITLSAFQINKENVYSYAYADAAPSFPYIAYSTDEDYYTYYAPKYQSQGLELDVNGKVTRQLFLNATASLIKAEVVDDPGVPKGNWLDNQPRTMFSFWGSYKFNTLTNWLKHLDVGYGMFYKGRFFASIGNEAESRVPANYTMDFSTGYNIDKFRIQLNVTNFTNRQNYLGSFGSWEPQWPRRTILGISYRIR